MMSSTLVKHGEPDSSVGTSCAHCRLPVASGLIRAGDDLQFCCAGCRTAYSVIHENGLQAFYDMIPGMESAIGSVGADPNRDFRQFDDPAFHDRWVSSTSSGNLTTRFQISNLHCAACIWLLEKLPQIIPGLSELRVNWAKQVATVEWNPVEVSLSQVARRIHEFGYPPFPVDIDPSEKRFARDSRRHLARIGFAAATAGNSMLIAAALYLGEFHAMSQPMVQLLRWCSCVVGVVALIGPGRIFLTGAVNAIRLRTSHMDLPIALALVMGTAIGLVNTIVGSGAIYFDSLAVLIFLLLIGRWIQFRQQHHATSAIALLGQLTPMTTRKLVDGNPVEVFAKLVAPGDPLEIRPGDLVPVDGFVQSGVSTIDESILTGESRLIEKAAGDPIYAGSTNRLATLIVEATTTLENTRINRVASLVESAHHSRPKIVQWADRSGSLFVTVVMIVACLTFLFWITFDVATAVDRTMALLIIACPCALAIATPLAISVANARCARRRILVKDGDVFQHLADPGIIWLDKTGTLTTGNMEIVQWHGAQRWQPLVASLERSFQHPVAVALQQYETDVSSTNPADVVEPEQHLGGVCGWVDGHYLVVGNQSLLESQQISIPTEMDGLSEELVRCELSPCWVAADGVVVALAGLGDQLLPGAKHDLEMLEQTGWSMGILSGDHPGLVQQVANRLGINPEQAFGRLSPEEKLQRVRDSFSRFPTVLMVGDGVNDSAALAAASVGIAVKNGAECSLLAAPVYFADDGLSPLRKLIAISDSTRRVMSTNLVISVGYNVVAAGLAFAGYINPLVAAILMPVSSLVVVGLSMNAGRLGRNEKQFGSDP